MGTGGGGDTSEERDDRRHLPVPYDPDVVSEDFVSDDTFWISRRGFLALMGAGGATAAGASMSRGQLARQARRALAALVEPAHATTHLFIEAERASDMVLLGFEFRGFSVRPGNPPAIVPDDSDARIVVHFPPQAIGEAVYFEQGGNICVDPAPILSDLSGPSRLVFGLPSGGSVPLPTMTVADLLDWSDWELRVTPVAHTGVIERLFPDLLPVPTEPSDDVTAVECPYALFLSPTDRAVFHNRLNPLARGVQDCWSAVLVGERRGDEVIEERRVVAVWARDYASAADATRYDRMLYSSPEPG